MPVLLQALLLFLLAIVVVLPFLLGRHRNRQALSGNRRELRRARYVIHELQAISGRVRLQFNEHRRGLDQFGKRLQFIEAAEAADISRDLADEAERILQPTLALSSDIARAYEEIRQQTTLLMSLTEVRTDPLTGVGNRRALKDVVCKLLALLSRYGSRFSIAVLDLDHFKRINDENGHLYGDSVLRDVAELLDQCARETDIVTRYGGEEFVVVMPETDLSGAGIFAERARRMMKERLHITLSGGIAEARPGESIEELLGRADRALYAAKGAGRDCVFQHQEDERLAAVERPAGVDQRCPQEQTENLRAGEQEVERAGGEEADSYAAAIAP